MPTAYCARAGDSDIRAKLADFGVSYVLPSAKGVHAVRSAVGGSVAFMPPEILNPPHIASTKTDVWSLGMLLWELWTGGRPYLQLTRAAILERIEAGKLPEWPPKTPRLLQRVAAKCCHLVRAC